MITANVKMEKTLILPTKEVASMRRKARSVRTICAIERKPLLSVASQQRSPSWRALEGSPQI
jgi:hypothetical protein